jgi:hypothetical protein
MVEGGHMMWNVGELGEEMVSMHTQESRTAAKITNGMKWGDGGRHTACSNLKVCHGVVEDESGYGDFVVKEVRHGRENGRSHCQGEI